MGNAEYMGYVMRHAKSGATPLLRWRAIWGNRRPGSCSPWPCPLMRHPFDEPFHLVCRLRGRECFCSRTLCSQSFLIQCAGTQSRERRLFFGGATWGNRRPGSCSPWPCPLMRHPFDEPFHLVCRLRGRECFFSRTLCSQSFLIQCVGTQSRERRLFFGGATWGNRRPGTCSPWPC